MIESIVKLCFIYVITRTFAELAFPSIKHLLKYVYWSALLMAIYIAVAPVASRMANDLHEVANTYTQGKEAVNGIFGWFNNDKFDWPLNGEITQGFNENNHGIDIAGRDGDKIKASKVGVVNKIGNDDIYGLYVVLMHDNGYETLYAHCSKVLVEEGDRMFAGDKIALVGSTGNSTGPHLHFEIKKNGKTINPKELID